MTPRPWAQCRDVARTDGAAAALRVLGPATGDPDPLLAAEGLTMARQPGTPEWRRGLAWLRLGLSEGLLDACVRYLAEHTTGGRPLIDQQMVKGDLADVAIDHLEIDAALAGGAEPERIHRQITAADRVLCRLLGASGFLADGPGHTAYLSELLADAHG